MRERAKRIYILIIKVNKLFSCLSSWCFLKVIDMFSVFLSSFSINLLAFYHECGPLIVYSTHILFEQQSVPVEGLSADRLPRGNLMFLKQIFAREAKLLRQYASFKNIRFPRGNLSDRQFRDINTLKSLLITTKSVQKIILNFSTFLDRSLESQM